MGDIPDELSKKWAREACESIHGASVKHNSTCACDAIAAAMRQERDRVLVEADELIDRMSPPDGIPQGHRLTYEEALAAARLVISRLMEEPADE